VIEIVIEIGMEQTRLFQCYRFHYPIFVIEIVFKRLTIRSFSSAVAVTLLLLKFRPTIAIADGKVCFYAVQLVQFNVTGTRAMTHQIPKIPDRSWFTTCYSLPSQGRARP